MENTDYIEFFKQDRFAVSSGIRLTEVKPGYAKAELTIAENHLNAGNVAQGGALFTLADLAMAAAANANGRLAFSIQSDNPFPAKCIPGREAVRRSPRSAPAQNRLPLPCRD